MIRGHWSIPDGYDARCEICYELRTLDQLAVDEGGDRWDICSGNCAVLAGIVERAVNDDSAPPR